MNKLIIIEILLLYFTLTACFEKKSNLYKKIEEVDYLIRNNQRDSAEKVFYSLDMTSAKVSENALYNILKIRILSMRKYIPEWDSILNFSEIYFNKTNNKSYLSEIYLYKNDIYYIYKDKYDSAAYWLSKSEKLAAEINDYYLLAQIYWSKIMLYYLTWDCQSIKKCTDLQLFYAEKSKNQRQIAYATLNEALAYKNLSQNDSAAIFLHAALLLDKYLLPKDIALIYNSLGELSMEKDQNIAKENFEKALEVVPDLGGTKLNLAKIYLMRGDFIEAEKICNEIKKADWSENKISILEILSGCKAAQNNINEAFKLQKQIIAEKDSINKRISKTQYLPIDYYFSDKNEPADNNYWKYLCLVSVVLCILLTINILRNKIIFRKGIKYQKELENFSSKNAELEKTLRVTLLKTNTLQELSHKQEQEIEHILKENDEKKQYISQLEKQLKEETQKNLNLKNVGEKLYTQIINNQSIASWTTIDMVNFIEYYRIINPDFVEDLDNNYNKLSPRYKIILILEDMKKSIDEIKIIMSFEETSYYSAKSRINGAKK